MKTENPRVRVELELRVHLEAVLRKGKILSEFVEVAVRNAVQYRRMQSEFQMRGEAAWEEYQRTSVSHAAAQVVDELRGMPEKRRKQLLLGRSSCELQPPDKVIVPAVREWTTDSGRPAAASECSRHMPA
jgi:hypothetical protein